MNYKQSIYLHILTIFFVLLGSLETASTNLMGFSFLNLINNDSIKTGLVVVIGLSVLYHIFNKYTFLPFLNYNVLPYSVLKTGPNNKSIEDNSLISVNIDIPSDNSYTHIIYWASNETNKETTILPMWDLAYGEFTNSGVELVNGKPKVTINVECPTSYRVPSLFKKKVIPKHVHYRFVSKDGMMSKIYTKYIKC